MADDTDDQVDEFGEVKGDVTAENNARQINARNLIARKTEIMRSKKLADEGGEEMDGVDDGIPDDDPAGGMTDAYPYQVTDETIKNALAGLPQAKDAPPPAPKTWKVKVNGQEKELTEEEMIARVQKIEAADQYLAEAKRQAEALRANAGSPAPSAQPADEPQPDNVSEDDLALVRSIQLGSEEEAAKALRAYLNRTRQPLSVNTDEVVKKVEANREFQESAKWFQENYPEIFADEDYKLIAIKRDEQIRAEELAQGIVSPYKDRYARIGNEIRKKFGLDKTFAEKKAEKKESLRNIPQASVKTQRPVEDEEDDSPSAVIAQMAARRGQIRL